MNISATTATGRERTTLVGFCALLLVTGVGLLGVAGPPRGPGELPRPGDMLAILQSSSLPVGPVTAVLLDLAWLMWTWIVVSLLLELALAAIELVASGASWLHSVRRVVNRLSLPLARRAVAAAFAVQVVSRGLPIVAAQTVEPADSALVVQVDSHPTAAVAADTATPTYLVREGDTLWSIAERAYGAGTDY